MPLKITLAPEEKIIVNGVVIANGGAQATLSIMNQAQILRGKEILTADDATSPAARVYYVLQCHYLFPERAADYRQTAEEFLTDYAEAAPSGGAIIDEIRAQLRNGQAYGALKTAKTLLAHEREILAHVSETAKL